MQEHSNHRGIGRIQLLLRLIVVLHCFSIVWALRDGAQSALIGPSARSAAESSLKSARLQTRVSRSVQASANSSLATQQKASVRPRRHLVARRQPKYKRVHSDTHLDGGKVHKDAMTSLLSVTASAGAQLPGGSIGMGSIGNLVKCGCCLILLRLLMTIDCNSRRLDCRRFKPIGRFLLKTGWDEFETFGVRVSVHHVQDIQSKGILGKKATFQVSVGFKWSKFVTTPTNDMRWEQTKLLEVPQGAPECRITLSSVGVVRNTVLATHCYETKYDMMDKADFWGVKQKIRMEKNGKIVGFLVVTFRKAGDEQEDELPMAGVSEDSSLAMEIIKEFEELCATPGYVKPEGKLEGQDKISLLSKVLEGSLRVIDAKGKDTGTVYIRTIFCNISELKGADMKKELLAQKEKARKKGVSDVDRKWYWVWYESKAKALDEKKWHYPDGFFPLLSISSVHRSPERDDQFVVKYKGGDDNDFVIYRRESGKGLETWVDGLELCFNTVRALVKGRKADDKMMEETMQRMHAMHTRFVQEFGLPEDDESWEEWHDYFAENNYNDDYIKTFYERFVASANSGVQFASRRSTHFF
eukprot:TRINITY_DN23716_c0_g1_i1.p1 TRINITY_DN23716_c0_g1~~TRINITY_DN23716_c0_g1_i1.p1  ORF type:complete len:583 (-),score=94.40 TRINITY_DN23716_c0_g1_i1:303-2051(-)